MKPIVLATLALAAGLAAPASAQREVSLDRTMLPYALSYAACVHRAAAPCESMRAEMIAQSEQTFRRFGPADMLQKRPRFARLLDGIDRGVARLNATGEQPSAALVGYMQCLGDAMQADSRFQRGVSVDQNEALDACVDARRAIPVSGLSNDEERRSRTYLFNLEGLVKAGSGVLVRDGLVGRSRYPNYG